MAARKICPRCCKEVEDVHTCTPTPLARALEQEIDSLRASLQNSQNKLKASGRAKLREEVAALRAENEALQHDIARRADVFAEQAGEIERLTEALQIVASPLKINGDDHASAVKHARAALAAKGE